MNGIFDLGAKCHVQGGDRIFDDIAEYMELEARIEEPEYMETDENLNGRDNSASNSLASSPLIISYRSISI